MIVLCQAFSDGCVGDWGGGDYQDLMSGLDCALAENDWIDAERLGTVETRIDGDSAAESRLMTAVW